MNNLVSIQNNQVVVSSKDIAEHFDKRHVEVLDKIRELLSVENSTNEFFHEEHYIYNGRTLPMYLMNRDGFSLLAMGFTGKKALQWKIKYIEAFNQMEQQLKNPSQLPAMVDIPILKTYKGEPVITLLAMEQLIGLNHAVALQVLKAKQIPYVHLTGKALREFKQENNYVNSASGLIVLNRVSACKLLESLKRLTGTTLIQLGAYFERMVKTEADKANTLELIRLNSIANIMHHIKDSNARSSVAVYVTQGLADLGLWTGIINDDWSWNTLDGWNKRGVLQNSYSLLLSGKTVSASALQELHEEINAFIATLD